LEQINHWTLFLEQINHWTLQKRKCVWTLFFADASAAGSSASSSPVAGEEKRTTAGRESDPTSRSSVRRSGVASQGQIQRL